MAEPRYILKILSGLHAGAEFYLPSGVTRLGRSADCDLILHDQGIDDEHIIFRCSAQEARVECPTRESAALLNGMEQLHKNGPYTITDYGLVSSAGLYLALGREGLAWDIPTPEHLFAQFIDSRPLQQQAEAGAASAGNADDVVQDSAGEPPMAAGEAAMELEDAAVEGRQAVAGEETDAAGDWEETDAAGDWEEADAAGAGQEAPLWRRVPRRVRLAGGGAALAVALLSAGLFYWHGREQQTVETQGGPGHNPG